MIYSKSFLKKARRSKQTTFEPSSVLPDDEGRVFVTDIVGAPVTVLGRLGRDGKWYIDSVGITPSSHEEEEVRAKLEACVAWGFIVLRDEPVAERMVRQGIRHLLNQPDLVFRDDGGEGAALPRGSELFLARLRNSRFKDEERLQATATKAMKGETPEETKARIDSTISIKRKIRPMTESGMTDLPLVYLFERDHEIERQEGLLLAGVLVIAPIITEAEFEKVTLSIIQSLLRMLQAGELQLQTEGWMKGMAPPGDDLTEEQANAIRAWSLKTRRVNVRVDDVGKVRLQ
jgi:hypothetical protein